MSTTTVVPEKSPGGLESIVDFQRYNSQHKAIQITAGLPFSQQRKRIENRVASKVLNIEKSKATEIKWIEQIQAKVKACEKQSQNIYSIFRNVGIASIFEAFRLSTELRDIKEFTKKCGAVVLILQEGVSRNRWKLGPVDHLIEGKDGVIR